MLIIKNAHELVTCRSLESGPNAGKNFSTCSVIKNGALVVDGEKIVAVGKTENILARFKKKWASRIFDASGKIILPGFIDSHTHLVFAGSRAEEYRLKLKGQSYKSLHKKKGGIHFTVGETRRASEDELFFQAKDTLERMFRLGTTTVEIKSGYGLTPEDELKILRVIKRLKKTAKQDIVATFLGAHTVPLEYQNNRSAYLKLIIEKMLPVVWAKDLAEYCDVFCDPLGFTAGETTAIFSEARRLGFKLRIHAEQTAHFGGAAVAARYKAASADHCDFLNDSDIGYLKKSRIPAVLLPGVLLHLMEWKKIPYFQETVKKIKKADVALALATDYNPGSSPVISMKLVADLALRFFRMDYQECLNAVTINAAYALNRASEVGSIEPGKQADILIVDALSMKDYFHGPGDGKIDYVIKKGLMNKI